MRGAGGTDEVIGLRRLAVATGLVGCLAGLPAAQAGCDLPVEADFTRKSLVTLLNEPMEFEFITDGRILIIEKVTGKVLLLKRDATTPSIALQLSVSMAGNRADGLLGLLNNCTKLFESFAAPGSQCLRRRRSTPAADPDQHASHP